jgi:predicted metal-dependent phosphoesterase TrpH
LDFKQSGGIDLHVHSTASDGTHTPQELLEMAARAGLQAIAITDHDTLNGSRQAFNGDIPASLAFLTGVEISVHAPSASRIDDSLHILGYGVDPNDSELLEALDQFQKIRSTRVHRIVDRLNALGVAMTIEQVMREAGGGTPGRPHVAMAMVNAGYAEHINDAFDRYLANGRPACVSKERMTCERAFELIHGAGGIPVLAHPYLIPCRGSDGLVLLVEQLCGIGLKGIEVYYPQHTPEAVAQYSKLGKKYGLLATGGSDFHGALIPEIAMGSGEGDLYVPYALYEKILSAYPAVSAR